MSAADRDADTAAINAHRWPLFVVVLPIVVVLLGVALALTLIRTSPKAELGPPGRQPRLVETSLVEFSRQQVMVQAMGVVVPARQIEIRPRVNGLVVGVSDDFVPGGRLAQGEMLLRLDASDFELIVREKASELARAQSELALEMGRQRFARQEYALRQNEVSEEDQALMLRRPQLAAAQAAVEKARISLEQAQLALRRTVIVAPFAAMVRERRVDVGVQVTTASPLAVLDGTERFWIQLAVPVDKLPWIIIPDAAGEQGSRARIYNDIAWGEDSYRSGRVIRLAGELEEEGRMAQLLVEVDDPLSLTQENAGRPILLLDSYLRVVIEGIELDAVVQLDRSLLHNGDYVWLMDENNELRIQPVEVLFRGPDSVLIDEGLREGERLITSVLSAPVSGMKLRERTAPEL